MPSKSKSRFATFLLLALIVAAGVVGGPTFTRKLRRSRRLKTLVNELARQQGMPTDVDAPTDLRDELMSTDEPEAVVALVDDFRKTPERPDPAEQATVILRDPTWLRRAIELYALGPEPRDPRPRAALETLARDGGLGHRFWALYLLAELDHPRHAREPDGFAPANARVEGPLDEARTLPAVRALATIPVELVQPFPSDPPYFHPRHLDDTPWRVLVQYAQEIDRRVVVDSGVVRLVPEVRDRRGGMGSRMTGMPPPDRACPGPEGSLEARVEVPGTFTIDLPQLGDANVEKALVTLVSLSGLEPRRPGPEQLVAVHPDRRAFLEWVVAVVRGEQEPHHAAFSADYSDIERFREALLSFDEPLALRTLLEAYAAQKPEGPDPISPTLVLDAGAISAATTAPDDGVRAAIAKLEQSNEPEKRFVGFYLEQELASPSLSKAPPELAGGAPVVVPCGTIGEAVAAVASATRVSIALHPDAANVRVDEGAGSFQPFVAAPWCAVLRLACACRTQGGEVWSVSHGDRGIIFGPVEPDELAAGFDSAENLPKASPQVKAALTSCPVRPVRDPRRALRALAAAEGCELREGPDHALSFEPKKSR